MINAMVPTTRRTYYVGTSRRITGRNKAIVIILGTALLFGMGKFASNFLSPGVAVGSHLQGEPTTLKSVERFGNGNIPVSHLTEIGDGFQLVPQAAKEFIALRSALERAGHILTVNSAYRNAAIQQEMIDKFGLLADGGRAAPLGQSEHGWGISVDLTLDFEAVQWMSANASTFGFEATVVDEPWHWTFVR